MKGGSYTIDIIHIPSKKRFCKSVEACSHNDAREYARCVIDEIRINHELYYGKMKISVRKSPFDHREIDYLYYIDS